MQLPNRPQANFTLLLISVLSLLTGYLSAQTVSQESITVEFSITRFDPSDKPSPDFCVPGKESLIPVDVPINFIAGPYKAILRDRMYLDFFKQGAATPSVSMKIPQGQYQDLLLVFLPKKKENNYAVLPIHVPLTKIKGGTRFIVNASETEVAIKYGAADPIVIPSLGTGLIPGPGGQKVVSLPVVILENTPKGWRTFSTEHWPYDPRERKFLFIYRSERTKNLKFHGVSDRVDLKPSRAP